MHAIKNLLILLTIIGYSNIEGSTKPSDRAFDIATNHEQIPQEYKFLKDGTWWVTYPTNSNEIKHCLFSQFQKIVVSEFKSCKNKNHKDTYKKNLVELGFMTARKKYQKFRLEASQSTDQEEFRFCKMIAILASQHQGGYNLFKSGNLDE